MLRKNSYSPSLFAKYVMLTTCVIFVTLSFNVENIKSLIDNEIQSFQKNFTSLSKVSSLYDDGRELSFSKLSFTEKASALGRTFEVLKAGASLNQHLSEIKLFIKFDELQKIYADRERALKNGANINPQEVRCKISSGDEIYKCKVKLKGDLNDHWRARDRISFKIKVVGGNILGMKRFSLQKPRARQFPYDQVFHSLVTKNGGFSSDLQNFIKLKVNGENWGVMNLEPEIDSRFLEMKGLKRLGVYRISNQDEWYFQSKHGNFDGYYPSDPTINLRIKGSDKILNENLDYLRAFSSIKDALWRKNGLIFERTMMIDNLALSLAWGGVHTLHNSNAYYTWNQYTRKLEPILTDQQSWQNLEILLKDLPELPYEYRIMFRTEPLTENELELAVSKINKLFSDYDIIDEINRYKNHYFPNDKDFKFEPITDNLKLLNSSIGLIVRLVNNASNTIKINDHEFPSLPVSEIEKFHQIDGFDDGRIRIYNLTNLPLTIEANLSHIEEGKNKTTYELDGSQRENLSFVEVQTDFGRSLLNDLTITARYQENVRHASTQHILSGDRLGTEDFHNLGCIENNGICYITDDLTISEDVTYDKLVKIEPGVTYQLKRGANAVFLNGLTAIGEVKKPINFIGDGKGGIYIHNKLGNRSLLSRVNFTALGAVKSHKYSFTGTVNGYGGLFHLDNLTFLDCIAEDQLNIVHAKVDIGSMSFENAQSDAFDCDFCNGNIDQLNFNSIGGDGLDISGSNLSVRKVQAKNVSDKAISVGEKSKITLNQVAVENVGTGIAVKDGSVARVKEIHKSSVKYDLLMTYIKKPFYDGPTELEVQSLASPLEIGGQICVREKDTILSINNENCPEAVVAVDDLYAGRMKK